MFNPFYLQTILVFFVLYFFNFRQNDDDESMAKTIIDPKYKLISI